MGQKCPYLTDVDESTDNAEVFTDKTNFHEVITEWENVLKIRYWGLGAKEYEGIASFC